MVDVAAINSRVHRFQRFHFMEQGRHDIEFTWDDIHQLMNPNYEEMNTDDTSSNHFFQDGDRVLPVYDSTAMVSISELLNFLLARIFPSNLDWFRYGLTGGLQPPVELGRLLDVSSLRMLEGLSDSNFYQVMPKVLRDIVEIGNTTVVDDEKPPRLSQNNTFGGMFFEHLSMSRVWWQLDRASNPIFIVVRYDMPAREAFDFFKEKPGEKCMNLLRAGKLMDFVTYLNFVYPNENHIPGGLRTPQKKRWVSIWSELQFQEDIRTSGFDQNPYHIYAWNPLDQQEYGHGLGNLARSDQAGLNAGKCQILSAIGRDLNPRLMLEHNSVMQIDDSGPGGVIVVRNPKVSRPDYLTSATNYAEAAKIFERDQDAVRRILLGDLSAPPETEPRSAFESRRREQNTLQRASTLADIVERVLSDLMASVTQRKLRAGALPELRQAIDEFGLEELDIRFVSPFFTSQRSQSANAAIDFVRHIAEIAPLDPSVIDRIDLDQHAKLVGSLTNVPNAIIRDDENVEGRRVARARQNALQQTAALAQGQPPEGS